MKFTDMMYLIVIQIHHVGFKDKIAEVPEEELDRILKLFEDALSELKNVALMELKFMELTLI